MHKFQIKEDGGLRRTDKIPVNSMADNLSVDQEGNVYVAGHPKGITFLMEKDKVNPVSPSIVEKIRLNIPKKSLESEEGDVERMETGGKISDAFLGKKFNVETVYADDGKILSTSSVAMVDTELKKSLISGLSIMGVLFCNKSL